MSLEKIKEFLQNYLDTVLNSRYSEITEERGFGPIEFTVHDVVMGSYQPPIIHVFLDSEPVMKKSSSNKPWAVMLMGNVDKDIQDFMKALSINFKIKVHWNKRPIFDNETLSADY